MATSTQGNPLCWQDGGYSFDFCCGEGAHNMLGNPSCWEGPRSFQTCCLPASYEAACWREARDFLRTQTLLPSLADKEVLATDLNLAHFCCRPGSFSAEVCWGGESRGKGLVQDQVDGMALNMSLRYVECCFPRLQAALKTEPPKWMQAQISQDLQHWAPLNTSDLDAFERWTQEAGYSTRFCRFQVTRSGVQHCQVTKGSHVLLIETLRDALHVLRLLTPLPDLDFFVSQDEAMCVENAGHLEQALQPLNLTVPVLAQDAQPASCAGILMPWWAFLQQDWTRRYTDKLARSRVPWEKKASKLFWRGSDTHCLLPGSCGEGGLACSCANFSAQQWMQFPRSRLVLYSMLMPDKVDAKFTKDVVNRELLEVFRGHQLLVQEIVPPEAHLDYKFLMYVDGVSLSDRLFWLLHTESVVFKAQSRLKVWLDRALRPWEHYLPVAEDLSDLPDRIRSAEEDVHLHEIALRAAHLASFDLSLEGSLLYLHHLLVALSQVSPTSAAPAPERAAPPAPSARWERQRQQQMNARQYLAHALEMLSSKEALVPEAPIQASVPAKSWTAGPWASRRTSAATWPSAPRATLPAGTRSTPLQPAAPSPVE
ncbi:unnamed protein product [Effrenium voratum]|uniref:Glycosyl transferase CAP10 domain-containing protein n=1 Tax=Effrenium voratum TaxID=2562239 RepID=A0AA36IUW4_9DINO|nr:unnamed protein product [Effrenium voratum]